VERRKIAYRPLEIEAIKIKNDSSSVVHSYLSPIKYVEEGV